MQNSGMGLKRTLGSQSIPVWFEDEALLLASGGFALITTGLVDQSVIPAGTPLVYDEAARTATVLSVAKIHANASNSATTYQIEKGSRLKVGDYLAVAPGGAAYAITVIDISNAAYDSVTVGTTLGVAVTAGEFAFASTATGASSAAYPAINGLLYEDTLVDLAFNVGVSAVIRGTVYARRIPYSSALAALPGLAHIIFSQSY